MSGLRANQLALSLTSSERRQFRHAGLHPQDRQPDPDRPPVQIGAGVSITGVNRELDLYLQQQIRTEQSGASYADLRSSIPEQPAVDLRHPGGTGDAGDRVQQAGHRGAGAFDQLRTTSRHGSACVNAAQSLTQQLNSMSGGIQSLRSQAELGLNSAVNTANTAMQQIVDLNTQLQAAAPATLRPRP